MTIPDLALALLGAHRRGDTRLTRKAGNFLGECIVDPQPLTDKQAEWLDTLLERAGMSKRAEVRHEA